MPFIFLGGRVASGRALLAGPVVATAVLPGPAAPGGGGTPAPAPIPMDATFAREAGAEDVTSTLGYEGTWGELGDLVVTSPTPISIRVSGRPYVPGNTGRLPFAGRPAGLILLNRDGSRVYGEWALAFDQPTTGGPVAPTTGGRPGPPGTITVTDDGPPTTIIVT